MIELFGDDAVDIFDMHRRGEWVAITTNSTLKVAKGVEVLVMGKGCAGDAANLYPDLQRLWGWSVKTFGNIPSPAWQYNMVSFPTKYYWGADADPSLIDESAAHLVTFMNMNRQIPRIYIPRPGAGHGGLDYDTEVRPILLPHFENDDQFIITDKPPVSSARPWTTRKSAP